MNEEKLDRVAEAVAAIGATLKSFEESTVKSTGRLTDAILEQGRISTRLEANQSKLEANFQNTYNYLEAVNAKVDKKTKEITDTLEEHKRGHWAWFGTVGTIFAIITGIIGWANR